MKSTTWYKLNLPENDDVFSVDVLNENARKIDTELHNLKKEIDKDSNEIGDIKVTVNPLDTSYLPCNGQAIDPILYQEFCNRLPTLDKRVNGGQIGVIDTIAHSGAIGSTPRGSFAIGEDGWCACYNTSDSKVYFSNDNFATKVSTYAAAVGNNIWYCDGTWISLKISSSNIIVYHKTSATASWQSTTITPQWQTANGTVSLSLEYIWNCEAIPGQGFVFTAKPSSITTHFIAYVHLNEDFTLEYASTLPKAYCDAKDQTVTDMILINDFHKTYSFYCTTNVVLLNNNIPISCVGLCFNSQGQSIILDGGLYSGITMKSSSSYYQGTKLYEYDSFGNYWRCRNCILPGYSNANIFSILLLGEDGNFIKEISYPNLPTGTNKSAMIVPFNDQYILIMNSGAIDSYYYFYITDDLEDPNGWRPVRLEKMNASSTATSATLYPRVQNVPIVWEMDNSLCVSIVTTSGSTTKYGFIKIPYGVVPKLNNLFEEECFYIKASE